MSPEERILQATSNLPREIALKVLMDVNQRINDWRASGGSDEDAYIDQQIRYAENVADAYEQKKTDSPASRNQSHGKYKPNKESVSLNDNIDY